MVKKHVLIAASGLVLLTGGAFTFVHKYYVSLTEIHVKTDKHTLDISSKLFTDDLEEALKKASGSKVDLAAKTGDKATENILFNYLNSNLKINVGGKLQTLTFVGFEIENDATWCYLEVQNFKGKGTMSVMNTLLYDSFPEQSNLVNVSWDNVGKSGKLSYPDKLLEFIFE